MPMYHLQVRSDIALHSPKGNLPKSGDKRAEFNRSTLSDHGMNSNSLKSSIDLNSPLVTTGVSARPSKKTSLELQLPGTLAAERMNTQVNDCDYTEALGSTSANSRNSKVNSHWRFSGSSSPSPAYFEGSATAAVTPVSGATSGFFTGSTYSLDSPISQAPLFSFQSRDLCSGFDTKHASSNTEGKLPADAKTQAAATEDTLEGQSFAWSLRKRASSEISPWSTLKRSRSVLTSPILCKENCVSCNSSPREPTEAKDYSMNDLSPPNLVDSVGRPVVMAKSKSQQDTPEFTNKHLIKLLDQRSPPAGTYDGNTSTPPPRRSTGGLYHIDHKQKTGSEPPSLKSASNGLNSSRSLSDSSMVPKVGANWARKNEFFVLR